MKLPTSSGLNCNQNTILLSLWETDIKRLLISWQNCCWMLCAVNWIVGPHQMLRASQSPSVYMNMTLLENNFFANAIKLKISRWDQPGLRVGPKSNDCLTAVLRKGRRGSFETQRGRPCKDPGIRGTQGKGQVKMEVVISVMCLQATELQGLLVATRS